MLVSRIVFRVEVFQSERAYRGDLRDVLAGFRPVEMVRVAGENDYGAGRIGFELTRVEFITQSDIKDAGNHGIDAILRVLVRHQLRAVGRFDPDGVRAGLRGLAHDDGQQDAGRKLRERFPIDIVRQDSFEDVLPELVRPDIALLRTLCGRRLPEAYNPPSRGKCKTSRQTSETCPPHTQSLHRVEASNSELVG